MVCFRVIPLTSVWFIGHLGNTEIMAGVGMGYVMVGTFCIAFCFGLNGTLESKVSQAYGNEHYKECGQWLNKGRVINTLVMLPILILFCSTSFLLKLIGQ